MEHKKTFSRSGGASRPHTSSRSRPRSAGASSRTSSSPRTGGGAFSGPRPANPRPFSSRPPLGRSFNASRGGSSRGGGKPAYRSVGRQAWWKKGSAHRHFKIINKTVITEEAIVFTPEHLFKDFIIDERLKANILVRVTMHQLLFRTALFRTFCTDTTLWVSRTLGPANYHFSSRLSTRFSQIQKKKVRVAPTRELAQQIEMELRAL